MASSSIFSSWLSVLLGTSVGALLIAMWLQPYTLLPAVLYSRWFLASISPYVTNAQTGVSYRGTAVNGVEHFQNIFYAEDTSGPNRFAPPIPFQPSPGTVVDATKAGAWCPQALGEAPLPFASPITNISEHCLSLRIARPVGTNGSANLPVLVWLHGGGDALGSASDQLYTPDGLVRQAKDNSQPVIYVGINYRLGVFGFATSKALIDQKQTNAGLRDQRAAFEWVRANIGAFGGDNQNVVAVGQSVGASSIALHLVSYSGIKGVPFQKAIMMSGASGTNFNIKSDLVAKNTATVAKNVGCNKSDLGSQETLNCLRKVPLDRLTETSVSLARQARPPFGELFFSPTVDGDYIPDAPSKLLRNGAFVKGIPIIGSWVANDGAWYTQPTITTDAAVLDSFKIYIIGLSEACLQRLLDLYPVTAFAHLVHPDEEATAQYYRAAQMNRDIWFTCPVIDFSWQYQKHGNPDVRLYEMNQTKFRPIFQYMRVPQWRVSHLSDIPYLMNEDVAAGGDNSPAQKELSAFLSGSAAAFAHTGNPSVSRGRAFRNWPLAYQDQGERSMAKDHPDALSLYVVDGPSGSGPATIASEMVGSKASDLERALEWENLFERCSFINSIRGEIDV